MVTCPHEGFTPTLCVRGNFSREWSSSPLFSSPGLDIPTWCNDDVGENRASVGDVKSLETFIYMAVKGWMEIWY
jgi:hypothetical protein